MNEVERVEIERDHAMEVASSIAIFGYKVKAENDNAVLLWRPSVCDTLEFIESVHGLVFRAEAMLTYRPMDAVAEITVTLRDGRDTLVLTFSYMMELAHVTTFGITATLNSDASFSIETLDVSEHICRYCSCKPKNLSRIKKILGKVEAPDDVFRMKLSEKVIGGAS